MIECVERTRADRSISVSDTLDSITYGTTSDF